MIVIILPTSSNVDCGIHIVGLLEMLCKINPFSNRFE